MRRCSVLNQKVGKGLTSSPFAVDAHDSRELKNTVGEWRFVDAALLPVPEPSRAVRILRRTHAGALTAACCGASPGIDCSSAAAAPRARWRFRHHLRCLFPDLD